jgi:hypothetical protein
LNANIANVLFPIEEAGDFGLGGSLLAEVAFASPGD